MGVIDKEFVKMRLDKPIKFDKALKQELVMSNAEKRKKGEPPQDQVGLIIELCGEAIAHRKKQRN